MEKKNNTGLIVLIIMLIIMVLGLGGYIVYEKVLSDKSKVKNENVLEDKVDEKNTEETEIPLYNNDNDDFPETFLSKDNYEILVNVWNYVPEGDHKGKIIDKLNKGIEYYFDYYIVDSYPMIEKLYDKDMNLLYSDESHEKIASLGNLRLLKKDDNLVLFFADEAGYASWKYYLYENYKLSYTSDSYGNIYSVFDDFSILAVSPLSDSQKINLIDLNETVLYENITDGRTAAYNESAKVENNEIVIYASDSNVSINTIDSEEKENYKNTYSITEESLQEYLGYKITYNVKTKGVYRQPTLIPPYNY